MASQKYILDGQSNEKGRDLIYELQHAIDIFHSEEYQSELQRERVRHRELVFGAIEKMRKEVAQTLEAIVNVYANPKVSLPLPILPGNTSYEEALKAAGIEVFSFVSRNSDLTYQVFQSGKPIGPKVTVKWPGLPM